MGLASFLRFGHDDSSEDPGRWSRAKLRAEINRLESWLFVRNLPSPERAAIQQVILRLYCESARRRKPRWLPRGASVQALR